jgi:hypothetical protein
MGTASMAIHSLLTASATPRATHPHRVRSVFITTCLSVICGVDQAQGGFIFMNTVRVHTLPCACRNVIPVAISGPYHY